MAKEHRQHLEVFSPIGGLKPDTPSTMLKNEETPDCENVLFLDNVVRGDRAFFSFNDLTLTGTPQLVKLVNGKVFFHTTSRLSYWDGTSLTNLNTSLSGLAADIPSSVYFDDLYIVTNNHKNAIKTWDFSASTLSDLGITETAGYLNVFGERLCFYDIKSGGNSYPRQVLWSVLGDPADISGTGAGFQDLSSMMRHDDTIMLAEPLGQQMIIYGRQSIASQEYTGNTNAPFFFAPLVPDVGLQAKRAFLNLEGRMHIFLGRDNIYVFQGGREVTPISEDIQSDLFSHINGDYITLSHFVYYPIDNALRLYYPRDTSTITDHYYEYSFKYQNWSRGERTVLASGEFLGTTATIWDTFTGSWDDLLDDYGEDAGLQWDSFVPGSQQKNLVVTGANLVKEENSRLGCYSSGSRWETKDFQPNPLYGQDVTHWLSLTFETKQTGLTVYYSTDSGLTWTSVASLDSTTDWTTQKLDLMLHSKKIRFRFSASTASGFWLRYFSLGFVRSTDRASQAE